MIGVSAAAQFMSAPGQSYSVAAFKEPMQQALQVTETDYSLAYAVATLFSGLALPIIGRSLDRFGGRRLLPVVAFLLAGSCLLIAQVQGLIGLYLSFGLVRCLGQGALTLISTWIVGEWFLRKRGLATALSGLGGSTSVMAFPLLNGWLINAYGWRTAWMILGAVVGVTMVIPGWLLLRDRPETLGLLPDGDHPHSTDQPIDSQGSAVDQHETKSGAVSAEHPSSDSSWHVSEVIVDRTFWKLMAVPICTGMVGTGLVFHQVSILAGRGISAQAALALISFQATVATIVALGAGWLTDRWRTERLLAIAMALLAGAILLLLAIQSVWLGMVYAAMLGLHGSILRSAGTVVWVNYYGRANQGTIRGISLSMMILAAAIGPLPLAIARDRAGTYTPALLLFAAFAVVAGCLVLTAKPPVRRSATSSVQTST